MKKFFVFAAALLVAMSSSAQAIRLEAAGNVGGFGSSFKSSSSFSANTKPGIGFNGGLMFDVNLLANILVIEPGVSYLYGNVVLKDGGNARLNTQWIQVPLTIGCILPVGFGSVDLYAGLYYGYAFKQTITSSSGSIDVGKYVFDKNDFGFCAKAGYTFPFGFGLFIGYSHGFLDLSKTSSFRAFTNMFRFGLNFDIYFHKR